MREDEGQRGKMRANEEGRGPKREGKGQGRRREDKGGRERTRGRGMTMEDKEGG